MKIELYPIYEAVEAAQQTLSVACMSVLLLVALQIHKSFMAMEIVQIKTMLHPMRFPRDKSNQFGFAFPCNASLAKLDICNEMELRKSQA